MKKQSAFTLIELMVTIAILAIIAVIATPSLSQMLHNTKVNTSSGDVLNFIQQARTESIRLGKNVSICGSIDGTTCTTTNKTNWSSGLVAKVAGTTAPIQKLAFDNTLLSITAPNLIEFNPVGSTTDEHEITLTIAGATTYFVCIDVIGRAFRNKTGCSS